MMTPHFRKFALTAHITSSVGWLGAVAGFMALAVAGLASQDGQMVRAAYLAMKLIGWFVIVPLSFASPLTGLVMSLGTMWGLFRHYWVVVKLLITLPATILLLVHMQPIGHLARVVTETTLTDGDLSGLRTQLIANAGAALLVLLVGTALSVYKPQGMTCYGQRKPHNSESQDDDNRMESGGGAINNTPRWVSVFWLVAILLILVVAILHLNSGGHHTH